MNKTKGIIESLLKKIINWYMFISIRIISSLHLNVRVRLVDMDELSKGAVLNVK